jgi:hypothetical protein
MEAIRTLLEALKNSAFFIKGEESNFYQIFRKMDNGRCKVYGSGEEKIFHPKTAVIPITLKRFGQLDVTRFILADSAKTPRGFIVPHNILVKCPALASQKSYGQAIYFDKGAHSNPVDIKNEQRVFDLKGIFHLQEVHFIRVTLAV